MQLRAAEGAPERGAVRRCTALLTAAGISSTGDGALWVAAPLLASELTRNALAVAAVSAATSATWLACGLAGGALVDRTRRLRRLLVRVDVARAVVLAVMATVIVAGGSSIGLLVAGVVLVTAGGCVFDPGVQAMIPALAGTAKQTLDTVNGRFWALMRGGSSFAGPPLGSALLAAARWLPFAADAASFGASAALIATLPEAGGGERKAGGRGNVAEGLRYVARDRALTVLLLGEAGENAAYLMVFAVFVLYAREVLGVRAGLYGLLFVPGAAGGIAASWWARPLLKGLSAKAAMGWAGAVQAGAWVLVVVAGQVWAAVAGLTVLEVSGALLTVAVAGAYQSVDPGMRGRVAGVDRVLSWGSGGVAALAAGVVADQFGLDAVFAAAAGLSAAAGLAAWLL